MGKTATKGSAKRVPFNWTKLKLLWDSGKSYLEMAKALDSHFDPESDDSTKATRARCSVAMTKGVKIDGKLVRFKRRSKPQTGKESKPKTTATKQVKKPSTKAKVQKPKVTATATKQVKKPTNKPKATAKKLPEAVPLTPSTDKTTPPTNS